PPNHGWNAGLSVPMVSVPGASRSRLLFEQALAPALPPPPVVVVVLVPHAPRSSPERATMARSFLTAAILPARFPREEEGRGDEACDAPRAHDGQVGPAEAVPDGKEERREHRVGEVVHG